MPLRHYVYRARSERKCRHSQEGNTMDRRGEGWIMFAAIVLAVAGIMRIFDAIWAFRYHGVLPGNLEAAIFGHSLKTYGWIYLVVAAVLHPMRGPGAQRIAGGSVGRDRGRRDRVHQRHLVDAFLPDLVAETVRLDREEPLPWVLVRSRPARYAPDDPSPRRRATAGGIRHARPLAQVDQAKIVARAEQAPGGAATARGGRQVSVIRQLGHCPPLRTKPMLTQSRIAHQRSLWC